MRQSKNPRILSKLDRKLNTINEMWIPNLPGNMPVKSEPTPEPTPAPAAPQSEVDEGGYDEYDDLDDDSVDWKDPYSPDYDRQVAENALYYTIGPLTDSPRWAPGWNRSSPSGPPPEYVDYEENGPAPQWTKEEVVMAFSGDDPTKDSPRSPQRGNMGGSPMWRAAKEAARHFNRANDFQTIVDCFNLGNLELAELMRPGFDQSRSAFIPWVIRNIKEVMVKGKRKDTATRWATGSGNKFTSKGKETFGDTKVAPSGLVALLKAKTGDRAREIGEQVKGPYRQAQNHDKHPHNPFGRYSKDIYDISMALGDAFDAVDMGIGDPSDIDNIKTKIQQMVNKIEDANINVPGIGTGLASAISNKDRKTKLNLVSADAPSGMDDTGTLGDTIAAGEDDEDSSIFAGHVKEILQKALTHDFSKVLSKASKFRQGIPSIGDVKKSPDPWGRVASPSNLEVTGRMTMAEMRFIIRHLGEKASDYPGKGVPRKNLHIPRDTQGKPWIVPGEDPEIEPIPNSGEMWHSAWARNGYPLMTPGEIAEEMTNEVDEFTKLGIPTARKIANKAGGQRESMSSTSVSTLAKKAFAKLFVAGKIYGKEMNERDIDESALKAEGIILEDLDHIDIQIIRETTEYIARIYRELYESKEPKNIVIPRSISTILKDHQNRRINRIIDSIK